MAEIVDTAAPVAAPAAAPVAAPPAGVPKAAAPTPAPAPVAAPAPVSANPATPATPESNEGYWPADWRQIVSKADAKVLARLERYASPEAAMQALISAQNRIAAGELKPALGKNASAEEIAAWRTEHGIPATPDKYDLGKDVEGMDKDALKQLLEVAHKTNQTPEQVQASIAAVKALAIQSTEQRHEADLQVQKESEDVLRAEWGPEFRKNINLIHGMLDGTATPELKDKLLGGRLSDGTPIGSSPEALKFLVGLALIQNPSGVVVPGSEANPMKGVEDEIAKIEKTLRENRKAYDKDETMQARYRDLLGAREKMKPR
jgi:hypothetical protein